MLIVIGSPSRLAELCYLVANAACDLLSKVRMLDLDPAMTLDGSRDKCAVCGNTGKRHTEQVYICDGCPDVYHRKCLPKGCQKPAAASRGLSWFCPRPECQQKRERQQPAGEE